MRRRDFITLLGSAVAAWPLAAHAQPSERVRRIGALLGYPEHDPETQPLIQAFRDGLAALGWVEGRNLRIEYRFAAANAELVEAYAKELVALPCEAILVHATTRRRDAGHR